jgi:hypothetical protein
MLITSRLLNATQILDNVGVLLFDGKLECSSAGAAMTAGYSDNGQQQDNDTCTPVRQGDICSALDQQPADFKVIVRRNCF